MTFLLALDQGTSSSRSIVFERHGQPIAQAQREITPIYPQPGWVEHDARILWQSQLETARTALQQAKLSADQITAIGIANQRETTVLWDRETGEPLGHAIVWQDRRTEARCRQLVSEGWVDTIREKTGLIIDPYFSATKIAWMLDELPGARAAARAGKLAFGTVDSWLIWNLTGKRLHITDVTNASRTMLWNIRTQEWDDELLRLFDIPASLLPQVVASSGTHGMTAPGHLGAPVSLGGIAGDQQAALFGQACLRTGSVKNTYGTGCFMLKHLGPAFELSEHGLITTVTAQTGPQVEYALEGSVFVGGAVVQWLRDNLQAIDTSADVEALAASVPHSDGVVFVPAFTGLGAPYWRPQATGSITGLTRATSLAHIARAALESIAFQSTALLHAMTIGDELKVDGGASANDLLMQIQADLLGVRVIRPAVIETTALGAAYLAGLSHGVYTDLDEIESLWRPGRVFEPQMSRSQAQTLMAQWEEAVQRTTGATQ